MSPQNMPPPSYGSPLNMPPSGNTSYDPRSGLHVAEQAHAAGVVEPAEPVAVADVCMTFTLTGADGFARLVEAIERTIGAYPETGVVTSSWTVRA